MRIKLSDLKRIIREVYMKPSHVRGVGPDVDREQRYGKITSTQAMVRFPQAIDQLVIAYVDYEGLERIVARLGRKPFPKDIADMYEFYLQDGKLVARRNGTDAGEWSEQEATWE